MEHIKILDHGFIRVVDVMGDDNSIVESARISYGHSTKTQQEDKGLIRYLMRNDHTSPFEMCEIKLHVKLPIFVSRQWIRHRTANVNEFSGRYSVMSDDFYLPELKNIGVQSKENKQGRDLTNVNNFAKKQFLEILSKSSTEALTLYKQLIKINISKELARLILPVNFYTEMYWKIDLNNLLKFIKLRTDKNAQYEIRQYANAMLNIIKEWVPITYEAFKEYKLD